MTNPNEMPAALTADERDDLEMDEVGARALTLIDALTARVTAAEDGWQEQRQAYKAAEQDCLQLCDLRDDLTSRAEAAEARVRKLENEDTRQKLAAANALLREARLVIYRLARREAAK